MPSEHPGSGNNEVRDRTNIVLGTALVSILFILPSGKVAFAAAESERRDAYFVNQFEKIKNAFEIHIQQLDKCIEEIEIFEKKNTELVFEDVECSKFNKMRPDVQELFTQVKSALEEYHAWINSLTENAFEELVKYSSSSQSKLLLITREYLNKHQQLLAQSEQVMQKQMQRLSELEKRSKEVEQQIETNKESEDDQLSNQSN